MAAPEQASTLFQVPLANHDVMGYKRIPSQRIFDPQNCGAATAKLLGLVTPMKADQMTQLGRGARVDGWLKFLNAGAPNGIVYSTTTAPLTEQSLVELAMGLFAESGTVILTATDGNEVGHYYVIAKDAKLTVGVLDPQQGRCAYGFEQTKEFIQRVHPGASKGTITVFISNQPRTISQALSDYTDGILSRQIAAMHVGGDVIRSSLPTRRAGRSSSSRKRRYSHRRRALRTGKGGYRSTGKHRKV